MNDSGIHRFVPGAGRQLVPGLLLPRDPDGGIELGQVPEGTILHVETRNNVYTVIPQGGGTTMIWGHPEYCPEPVLVTGLGASIAPGHFRENYLCPGMRLNFPVGGRRVSTSRIVAIRATKSC